MNNHLVVTKYNKKILSIHYEDGLAVQINASDDDFESLLGNIYVGKVKNIVKNIEAAFVEIADGIMCYYSLIEEKNTIFLTRNNNSKVTAGDEILVQVKKEAVNTKAPVVTGYINITGRYTVLTHGKTAISVSSKITDLDEKKRIKDIIYEYKNNNFGIIARTNSNGCDKEIVKKEIEQLQNIYKNIIEKAKFLVPFSLVFKAERPFICDIRDSYSQFIDKIVTDDEQIYEQIKDYMNNFEMSEISKLEFFQDDMIKMNVLYGINNTVSDALKEKVWLKSGGTIVIQPTEALVAIDVNTSKAIKGNADSQKAFLKTNLEAAKEIARQLRLRNLGGIIIVDFIDLIKEEDKRYLLNEFMRLLQNDPIKATLVDMTGLNLVEVTRKKVRKPLYQQLKSVNSRDGERL